MADILEQAYNSLYSSDEETLNAEEERLKKLEDERLASYYKTINDTEQTPLGYQNLESIDNVIEKEVTSKSYAPTKKKSLTELAEDDEFSKRSERFLEGIESNDNIFEYLRDAEYSLSSAVVRSFQTGKWTEEQKEDYNYLNEQFQNADLKGFREHFGLVKDLAGDLLLDPLNIITAMFAIPTGAGSIAAREAIRKAAQMSTKAFTKSKLKKDITKKHAQDYALFGAAEGAGWGGLHNYFMQDMNVDLGLIDDIDLSQSAAAGFLGGIGGGILGAGVGAASSIKIGQRYAKFAEKEFKYANEDNISFTGPQQRKLTLEDWEIDQATREVEDLNLLNQDEDVFFNIDNDLDFKDVTPSKFDVLKKQTKEYLKKNKINQKSQHKLNVIMANTTGKATTAFLEDAKKNPLLANFLRKMRHDYDTGLISEGERKVKKATLKNGEESQWSFGEFVGRQFGKYHYGLNKSLNNLYRTGWRAKIVDDQNDSLYALLSNKNIGVKTGEGKITIDNILKSGGIETKNILGEQKFIKVDTDIAEAYKGIRTLLDDSFDEAQGLGLFKPNTTNQGGFMPRLYKFDVLSRNRNKFQEILIRKGHADTINEKTPIEVVLEDGTTIKANKAGDVGLDEEVFQLRKKYNVDNFEQLAERLLKDEKKNKTITQNEIDVKAKQLKAQEIVDDMLDQKYTPYELRKAGANNSLGFFQARRFNKIEDKDIVEFVETDVQQVLENYFTNMSQSQGRKKYFGNTLLEFEDERQAIITQMINNGSTREEAEKVGMGIQKLFKRVTGLETYQDSVFRNTKVGRNFSDIVKFSQQAAHLPFATLSSITEPLILLSRANAGDTKNVLNDIRSSLVKEGENIFDRTFKAIKMARGQKVKGWKDVDDEVWGELHQTGLALEQAVQERIEGLAGEALNGAFIKQAQQFFFKTNLLTQWTKAVQLASFTTGKRLIKQNAEQLYYGKTLTGRNLTKNNREYLTKQLNELGVDDKEALQWYKNSLDNNGKYNSNHARGLDGNGDIVTDVYGNPSANGRFYSKDLIGGANRFTKEIILNPSTAEANRPLWFSSPSAQFLVQFAGYPTVFNNTILKRFINEGKNNKTTAGPKIISTAILMTAVAHVGNEIRSNGKATIDYQTGEKKSDLSIIGDAARRWGAFGPVDYGYRFNNEFERNVGGTASVIKTLGGPIVQDVTDAILYRKGMAEVAVTNFPYYSAYDMIFGEGTKASLRTMARGSKLKNKKKKFKGKYDFSKGGIVKNVPNVTDEPDEMQNRITGQPFNATSEAAQDIEDRELKSQMEGLGL